MERHGGRPTVRVPELLVRTALARFHEAHRTKDGHDFARLEDGRAEAPLRDDDLLRAHKLRFELRFAVLEHQLDGLAEILDELIQAGALRMGSAEAGDVAHIDPGVRTLLDDGVFGRLTSITDAAVSPNVTAFAYDAAGNRVQVTDALGRKTVLSYDDLDRLLSSQAQGSPAQPLSPALTTSFEYDAAGNVTTVIDPKAQETTYVYSALSELTAVTQPLGQTVAYDPRGRRVRTTNARGQALVHVYEPWGGLAEVRHYPTMTQTTLITTSPGKVWVYDGDGNPVSANAGLGSEETFAHDASNRMRGYTTATTSSSATYLYDPFARRMKKSVNGTATWFLWDGDLLLAQFDGSGNRDRRYAYTVGFAPSEQAVVAGSGEDVQSVHADHLDTPRGLSGSSSLAVWRAAFKAFGSTTPNEDPDGDLADVAFAMRFPGQFADSEHSLYDNRHRIYAPDLSRYLQSDPLGLSGDPNPYAYALSSPLSAIDPRGLDSQQCCPEVCELHFMLVTAYCDVGPGKDWSHYKPRKKGETPRSVGPGTVATANTHRLRSRSDAE